jgi:hypothetical protein
MLNSLFHIQNVNVDRWGAWREGCLANFKSPESTILAKSEDRWKIICSIAQDSGDSSKGKSSVQYTSHYRF